MWLLPSHEAATTERSTRRVPVSAFRRGDRRDDCGKLDRDGLPEDLLVRAVVVVRDEVPHGADPAPVDLGMSRAKALR